MKESIITKYKYVFIYIFITSFVSYFAVYKVVFIPNGYEIALKQENYIINKNFNLAVRMEDDNSTISFCKSDEWKGDELVFEANRQKFYMCSLFIAGITSIFLLFLQLKKGEKFWLAILKSNILFSILVFLGPFIRSLKRIFF
ncbi:hypothetical protein [Bacillus sp. AP8]|nr:hypothetical protein [Bacillus sp. AP8]